MNKIFIAVLLMLFCAIDAQAQTTSVTATITDSDSIAWAGGSYSVTFVGTPGFSGTYQYQGSAFTPQKYTGALDNTGTFAATIPSNPSISPAGTQWMFTLCPQASAGCSAITLSISGSSLNLSSTFSAQVKAPRFAATGNGAFGYSTVEINQVPQPGGSFYNVTSQCLEVWVPNTSSFSCAGTFTGTVNNGTQFKIGEYPNSGSNPVIGPSGLSTDSSGNNLNVPGVETASSATVGTVNAILYVDGVKYTTLAAALAACPSIGCTVIYPDAPSGVTFSSVVAVSVPAHIIFGKMTITCAMADPGTSSGCINVTSDNVEIEGQGSATLITQPNAQNIETLVFLGPHGNIKIHNLKFDADDANQTDSSGFNTSIRSSAGSHDIRIWNNEFTRGGDRAIDLRGENRSWINGNYFHQTGLCPRGQCVTNGNSISVDVDGATQSTDCWLTENQVDQQGDALACAHALRVHIAHNTIRGAADFGINPTNTEAGIDATGDTDTEVVGNHLINVRGPQLSIQSFNIGGTIYTTRDLRVADNIFVANTSCCGLAATDPRVSMDASAITSGQSVNVGFVNNTFDGVHLTAESVINLQIKGNGFHNVLSSFSSIGVDLEQTSGNHGVMQDFVVSGNSFSTDNSTLLTALNLGAGITTPDSCTVTDNATSSSVTGDITAISGFPTSTCLITRSNKSIGITSNSQVSPITVNSAGVTDTAVIQSKRLLGNEGSSLVRADFAISSGWGSTATLASIIGTDEGFQFTITAGGPGIAISPTWTLTFHDGAFPAQPFFSCSNVGTNDAVLQLLGNVIASTTVLGPVTYEGTPTSGDTYTFVCIGR